jgi:biotin synthase
MPEIQDVQNYLAPRADWSLAEIEALFDLPFNDLLFVAHSVHRANFDANEVQKSTLLSVKTGGCPEDCGYCSQSAKFETGIAASKLVDIEAVRSGAARAKAAGASRYCMGAAWRSLKDRDVDAIAEMIGVVSDLGMESCMTLGMLTDEQAQRLKQAGLDYYNHNVDTSEEYYAEVITTRTYDDRLDTIKKVQQAGIKVCAGGILGLGETVRDRASMLRTLANLTPQPESVPINKLIPIPGTPLAKEGKIDPLDFVRCIAVARITLPRSVVRLSAGREWMSDEMQALCFFAGANSIFIGEALLTAPNPELEKDEALFARLGLKDMPAHRAAE